MKRLILALALPALLVSCKDENAFTIQGDIKGLDGKKAFLEVQNDSTGPKVLDTANIANGKFVFKGEVLEPSLYAVRFESVPGKSFFIGEAGEIQLMVNKDTLTATKAKGTPNNDKLMEFTDGITVLQKEAMAWQKKNQQRIMNAQMTRDTAELNKIKAEVAPLRKKMDDKALNFIKSNNDTYVALLLIKNRMYSMQSGIDEVEELYNSLSAKIKNSTEGKAIGKRIANARKITVGKPAPDFTAPTPEGGQASLHQSLGKVTIIDFWASWCKPCRQANPEMVKLYADLHDKGLNIIGVSLDNTGQGDRWKEAITKDGLTWPQVSNLKGWDDPIAKLYNVESIPQLFVLDRNGIVIAKDIHGAELRARVEQALNPAPVGNPISPMATPIEKKTN